MLGWVLWPTLLLSAIAIPVGHQRGLANANEAYDRTLLGSAMAKIGRASCRERV